MSTPGEIAFSRGEMDNLRNDIYRLKKTIHEDNVEMDRLNAKVKKLQEALFECLNK